MNSLTFDAVIRHVAGERSRYASSEPYGATRLAALANPVMADARNRKKQKTEKKARKKCKGQVEPCIIAISAGCAGDPDCLERAERCCPVAGRCDLIGFFDCLAS